MSTVLKFPIVKSTPRSAKVAASRYTRLHNDGLASTAERRIARMLGMPEGSLRVVYPSGRRALKSTTIGNVKRAWIKAGA